MNTKAVTRTKRRAQITRQDVLNIVKLVAKRLTESEAAEACGIRPRTWYGWKENHRHQAEYQALLVRARAKYIAGNLEQMEKAAAGRDGIRHDWRAADRLNAIVAPDRYGQQATQAPAPLPAVLPSSVLNVWIDAGYKAQPQVADASEPAIDTWTDVLIGQGQPKQLPESTEPKAKKTR